MKPATWIGPGAISAMLLLEMVYMLSHRTTHTMKGADISPAMVGALLFTKYILVVELAAFLLAAGIIGAYHLGQKEKLFHHRYLKNEESTT